MSRTLGTMRRVKPKDVWSNGEEGFTSWLTYEEGIGSLGEAVGLNLDWAELEVSAGQYRADIVCIDDSDVNHPRKVIVENQIRSSNHDHLGKLVTYGAVLEADVCIWVATRFTKEHLHAVDELNYPSSRLVDYYCVKLSVFRINDSLVEVHFDVLVGPEGVAAQPSNDGPVRELFWNLLDEELAKRGMSNTIPGTNLSYRRFDIGFPGVSISLDRDGDSNRVGLRIYPKHAGARTGAGLYQRLIKARSAINREIGEPVTWQRPSRHWSSVEVSAESHLHDESKWEGEADWMIKRIEKLRNVLLPRLGTPPAR